MTWRLTRVGPGGKTAHLVTIRDNQNGRVTTLCGYHKVAPREVSSGDSLCMNCDQTLQDLNRALEELTDVAVV